MVGDGLTDVQAGAALGLRTAFLGPRKCDACKIMEQWDLHPTCWAPDLAHPARRDLPVLDDGPHRGYALQWFAFALIAVACAVIVVQRERSQSV